MVEFLAQASVLALGAIPLVSGLWAFGHWRGRHRNAAGTCAGCGDPWPATEPPAPFLVQGRLVCVRCAARMRRRLPWELGLLGLLAAGSSVFALLGAQGWMDRLFAPMIFLVAPPLGLVLAIGGAVGLMRLQNRRARFRPESLPFEELEGSDPGNGQEPRPRNEEAGAGFSTRWASPILRTAASTASPRRPGRGPEASPENRPPRRKLHNGRERERGAEQPVDPGQPDG